MSPVAPGISGRPPLEVTSFVGRDQELREIRRLLETSSLVTLVGPGGVGKTRLAVRAAAALRKAFPDGAWLVELADVDAPGLLERRVRQALGVVQLSAADDEPLTDYLADRHLLLVLDSCEHVVDEAARLADRLLRSCPRVRLLAASRELLGVAGEQLLLVRPLDLPGEWRPGAGDLTAFDSVVLFADRAAVAAPGFEITADNEDAVARIVTQLDGLPLAIELAAARLGVLSPAEIADRLADRYQLLTDRRRGVPTRHQTLRLCVDWSFLQCTAEERILWSRLSVFVAGFELDAVEGVCGFGALAATDILDLLQSLVDKSIVVRTEGADRARFRMLETMRAYGRERLEDSGEHDEVRTRHRSWFRDLVTKSGLAAIGPDQGRWWSRLDREQADVRAALEAATAEDGEAAAELVVSLEPYWTSRAQCLEVRQWLGNVLAATDGRPGLGRQAALALAVNWESLSGDDARAARLTTMAEAEAAELGDTLAKALASYGRGFIALHEGDFAASIGALSSAVAGFRERGNLRWEVETLSNLMTALAVAGRPEDAERVHDEAMRILVPRGECYFRAHITRGLTNARMFVGDWQRAHVLVAQSLELFAQIDDRLGFAWGVSSLALCEGHSGSHERATVLAAASARFMRDLGMPPTHFAALRDAHRAREDAARAALGKDAFDAAFERGRAMHHAELVAFALQRPASPDGADRVGTRTSVLTAREQEVAGLVADGLTNKQIAARLVISPRTARGHVENILAKLGFDARTQIASWFARRQPEE